MVSDHGGPTEKQEHVGNSSHYEHRSGLLVRGLVVLFLLMFTAGTIVAPEYSEARSRKAYTSKSKHKGAKKAALKKKRRHRKALSRRAVKAKAIYCIDLKRKKIVLARNANRRLPIASLTKLVTALVALDRMPLDKKIRVPKYIRKVPKSRVGLRPGDVVTVRGLLHGLLIGSGNDCAEALACGYPGGRRHFIRAMNKKARRMGARYTRFYTPSGLDRRIVLKRKGKRRVRVRSNVSTAREMAHIARQAFANKVIHHIVLKKRYVMHSVKSKKRRYYVRSTNKLLSGKLPLDGGKTGYTNRAGHCLATKFTPGKNSFVIVVLGSPDHFRDTRLVYRKALHKARALRKKTKEARHKKGARHRQYLGRGARANHPG
jgi:D-alanyl-D-alanine carboxypeptidase